MKIAAGRGLGERALNAVSVIDLPAFEFVEERLVADVQAPGSLLPIPAGLFKHAKDEFFLSVFGGARTNVFQRHVVFLGLHWSRRDRVGCSLLDLGKVHVHIRQDQVSLDGVLELAHVARPVVSKEGIQKR